MIPSSSVGINPVTIDNVQLARHLTVAAADEAHPPVLKITHGVLTGDEILYST